MSFIHVKGNSFVNDNGDTVVFHGVNISDPDKLVKNGIWGKRHFEIIKEWGADLVRVPIHPIAWHERGQDEYLKLLDKLVVWASDLHLYLNLEWHSIGNLKLELFQHEMHKTTKAETFQFWRIIANRYQGIPAVAFYELFNEPTTYNGQLGEISWAEWKEINEDLIKMIFAFDKKVIPLVGGFNWAYDLTPVKDDPISIEGIGYVTHPYPLKAPQPWVPNWEKDWGYVADKYPVIASEIGYMGANDPGAHIPCISDESYGIAMVNYLHKKGISWTVWNFDPHWPPQMIKD